MASQRVLCLISVFPFSFAFFFYFSYFYVFTECCQHSTLLILGTRHFESASAQCFIFSSRTYWPSDTNKWNPNFWICFWESVLRDGAPRTSFTGLIKNQYGYFFTLSLKSHQVREYCCSRPVGYLASPPYTHTHTCKYSFMLCWLNVRSFLDFWRFISLNVRNHPLTNT